MNLRDKRVVFLGDSITEGAGVDTENLYHQILKRELNLASAVNCGISGTRIAKQPETAEVEPFDGEFVTRAQHLPDCDYVFVFGGTNDFGHGAAPFGSPEDTTYDSFCGACNVLFENLTNRYGAKQIIVILPLHRFGEDSVYGDGSKKTPSHVLKDYVDTLRTVCNKYGVNIVDLWEDGQLNPNIKGNEIYFMDGLHPNTDGHRLMAEKIIKCVKNF